MTISFLLHLAAMDVAMHGLIPVVRITRGGVSLAAAKLKLAKQVGRRVGNSHGRYTAYGSSNPHIPSHYTIYTLSLIDATAATYAAGSLTANGVAVRSTMIVEEEPVQAPEVATPPEAKLSTPESSQPESGTISVVASQKRQ